MKALAIAAFALAAPLLACSQDWRESTLYLHNGDSLKGQIDFRDWKISPASIRFRSNNRVVSYDRDDLISFIVHYNAQRYQLVQTRLKYYFTVPIAEGTSPVEYEDSVSVYAEVLYSSPAVTLYSLQDKNEDERLIILAGRSLEQLIHFNVLLDRNGQVFKKEDNTYRQQLSNLTSGCDIRRSGLVCSSQAIIPVLREYSKCQGFGATIEKPEATGLANLGITAGLAGYKALKTDYSGTMPFVGIDFQVLSKRRLNKNFIWIEAGIMQSWKIGDDSPYLSKVVLGLYGGSYLGKGRLQPLVFTGLSSINRAFDSGIGVGYDKRVVLTSGLGLLTLSAGRAQGVLYSVKLKIYPRFKAKPVKPNK